MIDPLDTGIKLVGTALTLWGVISVARRADKKVRDDNDLLQTERHEQNQKAMGAIANELKERPAHVHTETAGALRVSGLRYKPKNGS
jgi:hypothetical protein